LSRFLFGPVPSRRFGRSLGIDLSPDTKRCNFDCLYCELEGSRPVKKYEEIGNIPPSPTEILEELERGLPNFPNLDVVTITSNGEPTLYPYLEEIVEGVERLKRKAHLKGERWKSLILSNGSRIGEEKIRQILKELDIVKLSLDTANPKTFKKLDRPVRGIKLEEIIAGMEKFRQIYRGELIIEILVVKGLNDTPQEFEKLRDALSSISPDRVDISTIDRPPAYRVEPVPTEKLWELAKILGNFPIYIPSRLRETTLPQFPNLSRQELMETLRRRPLTEEDLKLFPPQTQTLFFQLEREGIISKREIGTLKFYSLRP